MTLTEQYALASLPVLLKERQAMIDEYGSIYQFDIPGTTEREDLEVAKCEGCGHIYYIKHLNVDGKCVGCERRAGKYDIFTEVENAQLVKPTGPCVQLEAPDGVIWDV